MFQHYKLKIYDDQLQDVNELINFLDKVPDDVKMIQLRVPEGACVYQCGVWDIVLASGKLDRIHFLREENRFWSIGYQQVQKHKLKPVLSNQHYRLACFIGRKNMQRMAIMYWLTKQPYDMLLSSMKDHIHWIPDVDTKLWVDNIYAFEKWVKSFDIESLDQATVRDQYDGEFHTVQYNLLNYYHQFDVELVVETYVRGLTFFPTEKTIRPIAGGKPMLVYGPKNYLCNLKKQGYQTWHDIWDESYDKYEGIERWIRMQSLITQIHAWSDVEWKNNMQRANVITEHNKQVFHDNNKN